MNITHATCQPEDGVDKQSVLDTQRADNWTGTYSEQWDPTRRTQSRSVNRPSTFDWSDAMHSSLKTAVLSAKPIRVCLISDSFMRHITEFSRVNTMFTAIELTGATPRHLDRRDSETLSRRRNPSIANRKQLSPNFLLSSALKTLHSDVSRLNKGYSK